VNLTWLGRNSSLPRRKLQSQLRLLEVLALLRVRNLIWNGINIESSRIEITVPGWLTFMIWLYLYK
jgi:hypothetical protein